MELVLFVSVLIGIIAIVAGSLLVGELSRRGNLATQLATTVAELESRTRELRQMQQEERALRDDAEAANRAKSEFLAIMSHELRTPLNAILGYVDLLQLGIPEPLPEASREHTQRVGTAARHLLGLIDEILSYSRLEAGRDEPHFETFNVSTVVAEVEDMIRPLAQEKGLRLVVECEPMDLCSDPMKLRQILMNLVGNAIKFTDRGEVRIIGAKRANQAILKVRDTGIGIAPEHMGRIFEPFRQVEHSRTRRIGGTGLGLTVTRRLATMLGGEVRAESQPARGSTFIVSLPDQAECRRTA